MNLRNAGSILGNLLTIRHDAFETVMMHAIVSDVIIDVAETNKSCKVGDRLYFCATLLLCQQRQFGVDHGCVISATTPDFTL